MTLRQQRHLWPLLNFVPSLNEKKDEDETPPTPLLFRDAEILWFFFLDSTRFLSAYEERCQFLDPSCCWRSDNGVFFSFLILSAFKLIDRMTSATNEM